MKELDNVLSTKDLSEKVKKDTSGTIVFVYNNGNYEVEFFNDKKETIDVIKCNKTDITLNKNACH